MKFYGYGKNNQNYAAVVELTETVNVTANTSTISWTFKMYRKDGVSSSYHRTTGNNRASQFDGVTYAPTVWNTDVNMSGAVSEATAFLYMSGSFTISHNADGTKSFPIYLAYSNNESSTIGGVTSPLEVTGTFVCQTIPRENTASVPASFTMDTAGTIGITKKISTYTTTITASFGPFTVTVANKTSATSVNWTPPLSWASTLPSSVSDTAQILVYTYSGNTLIGTPKSYTTTVKVPNNNTTKPTISATAAATSATISGKFIAGHCKATISGTVGGYNSAGVVSVTVNGAAATLSGNSFSWTSPAILNTQPTYTLVVTDTRGFSRTITVTPSPWYDYSYPAFSNPQAYRSNSSGTKSSSGTYLTAKSGVVIAASGAGNSYTLTVAYKLSGAGSYGAEQSMTAGTMKIISGLSVSSSYMARLTLRDTIGNTAVREYVIPTADRILNFKTGGKGMGIGKFAETDGKVESAWNINVENTSPSLRVTSAVKDIGVMINAETSTNPRNAGVYDYTNAKWLLYSDASGNIHLGAYSVGSASKPIYLAAGVPTECDESTSFYSLFTHNSGDFDSFDGPGIHYISGSVSGFSNAPVSGSGNMYAMLTVKASTSQTMITQEFQTLSNNHGRFVRVKNASGWTAWKFINYEMSSGTGNGWTWKKYADGTCDAWYHGTKTPTCTTARGGVYSESARSSLSFPFTINNASIQCSVGGYNSNTNLFWAANATAYTASNGMYYMIMSATSNSNTVCHINIYVHGTY